jgi:hypothetical protein
MARAAAPWVDAGPFRAHLRHVMGVGDLSATEVATLAGVPPRLAVSLAEGRAGRPVRKISPATARALLQVTAADARGLRSRQVPAAESRRRLRRLRRQGAGLPELATGLGVGADELTRLAAPGTSWCSALLALRLLTLTRVTAGDDADAPPEPLAA